MKTKKIVPFKNPSEVRAAIPLNPIGALKYADEKSKNDFDIVLLAIEFDPRAFEFASLERRGDERIFAKTRPKIHYILFQFLEPSFRKKKIEEEGFLIRILNDSAHWREIYDDAHLCLLKYVDKKYQDRKIISAALDSQVMNYRYEKSRKSIK